MYDIGQSVYVKVDGQHYSGIVKNVGYGSDDDDEDDGGEKRGGGGVTYEVEFSDGEIWDVDPENMMENDDED